MTDITGPQGPDIRSIAREMMAAQAGVRQLDPFTAREPGFDLTAAYAVAQLIHEARVADGAVPVGRKVGFSNPDMWDRFGVRAPIWAHMYDATVVYLEGPQATCSLCRFAEPRIEPEIVFHFRSAPPAGSDLAALLASIDWVAHGFEVVQSHFPGWHFKAPDTVADGSLHARLLIGKRVPVAELGDDPVPALESFSLSLFRGAELVETGRGSNVLGHPLAAVAHLIDVLAGQPGAPPLAAGEIVTTGTVTTAQTIRPGQTWRTEIAGIALPGLAVSFAA
jgi:2-oxo-3-hexenedioate decarboxylase